jgi:hypothetical protein
MRICYIKQEERYHFCLSDTGTQVPTLNLLNQIEWLMTEPGFQIRIRINLRAKMIHKRSAGCSLLMA